MKARFYLTILRYFISVAVIFFVLFADFYSPLLPAPHKIRAHPRPLAKQRAYTNFSMIFSRLNFTLILRPLAKIKSYSQTPLGFNEN